MNRPPVAAGESVVIVGAGQAGTLTAEALRGAGHTGAITLLGDEPCGPYHRPPLSKAWLAGELSDAQLMLRAPQMLEKKQIALRTGVRVLGLDRARQLVHLDDGSTLPYAGLVLATGAAPRTLALPGAQAPNVLALRSRDDAGRMAAALERCAAAGLPVAVIGGGFIGLEVAATARKKGLRVTVLEAAPRLLGRVLAPLLSDWFAALHRGHGVELVLDARIEHIATEGEGGEAVAVQLADGRRLPCGLVVLGVGVSANDALAREAGLACEGGIVVDACARTADPRIVAAGDCTARRLEDGGLLRLESVHNATEQAKSAAAALLGQERPFTATPWFWSDQYERKLQMAGLSAGADAWVLRGELGGAAFSVCHYRADRLVAVDSVNDARTHLLARKLLDAGVSPTAAQAADTGLDLGGLLAR
ncbi:NAD(P)/FAD-dependent oxidoreductase [Azohydromonas lata]|uniref:NAD(P)/FAD-dependent oxidoreductase n=1 Tax=Azohydromonas lata TaxID=45677 RepID=UPI000AB8A34F|nr:FAD-dependent oxidoreductase [Azohydromonas lata]